MNCSAAAAQNRWHGDDRSSRSESDDQGKKAGFHRGGYFRFSLDVTDYINRGQSNELVVFVYDPTDSEGDVASMSPIVRVNKVDDTSRKADQSTISYLLHTLYWNLADCLA